MNSADLVEYCHQRGVLVNAWRSACEQANDWNHASSARLSCATREEKKRNKMLERELVRKEKAWSKQRLFSF